MDQSEESAQLMMSKCAAIVVAEEAVVESEVRGSNKGIEKEDNVSVEAYGTKLASK